MWVLYQWAASALTLLATHYIHSKIPDSSPELVQLMVKEYAFGDELPPDPYRPPVDPGLHAELTGRVAKDEWQPKSWHQLNELFSVQRMVGRHERKKKELRDKLHGPALLTRSEDYVAHSNQVDKSHPSLVTHTRQEAHKWVDYWADVWAGKPGKV